MNIKIKNNFPKRTITCLVEHPRLLSPLPVWRRTFERQQEALEKVRLKWCNTYKCKLTRNLCGSESAFQLHHRFEVGEQGFGDQRTRCVNLTPLVLQTEVAEGAYHDAPLSGFGDDQMYVFAWLCFRSISCGSGRHILPSYLITSFLEILIRRRKYKNANNLYPGLLLK